MRNGNIAHAGAVLLAACLSSFLRQGTSRRVGVVP